jgi:hypothetical protein
MAVRTRARRSRVTWETRAVTGTATTLVVETTNFTDKTGIGANGGGQRHSAALTITERFTMIDANTLQYEAVIDDPQTWTRPWTIAVSVEARQQSNLQRLRVRVS